jgi:uncharacterized membrane protein YgcG
LALAFVARGARASQDAGATALEAREHVVDRLQLLTPEERRGIEGALEGIWADTRVDVVALLTSDDTQGLELAARAAGAQLGGGPDSDSLVLLALSSEGPARILTISGRSRIDSDTAAGVESAASSLTRSGGLGLSLRATCAKLGAAIRAGSRPPSVRPAGTHDWSGSFVYAIGALATAIAAVASWRRRSLR